MKVYFGGKPSQWAWGKTSQTNLWFLHFSGKRIQFWCNNETVVAIINSGNSNKAPRIMDPLRFLVLLSIKHNISLSGPATSLGYLTKSLMPSPSFRTHVSWRWLPRLKRNPCTIPPLLMTLTDEIQPYAKWGMAWTTNRTYELPRLTLFPKSIRLLLRAPPHLFARWPLCAILPYRSPARATFLLSICASAD